jgi:hypothetical protein
MTLEAGVLGPTDPENEERWYVYGVLPWCAEVPVTTGIEAGRSTIFIAEGPIMAVASLVSQAVFDLEPLRRNMADPHWLAEKVCQHEAVVEVMMARGPVLPMKFGTIFRSPDAVRRMLRQHAARFQEALDCVRDKEEWAVKGYADRAALQAAVLHGDPGLLALSTEASTKGPGEAFFLRRKIEAAASAKAQEREGSLFREAVEAIHRSVVEMAQHPPFLHETKGNERIVLALACLVRREGVETFLTTVEWWNRDHIGEGVRLIASGPWPPYHFVPRLADA